MNSNKVVNNKSVVSLMIGLIILIATNSYALPANIETRLDVAYGESEDQALDVYYPSVKTRNAPVIFMVHGGAWRVGDKASKSVVKNKVAHWVPKGFIFVSVNYRMLPNTRPVKQAEDIEKALEFAQRNALRWGGAPEKFILMGHSAGAHLVALVSARNDPAQTPWLGTVALDSAAYDVVKIMSSPSPARFYKKAFGKHIEYWKMASPILKLEAKTPPFLAICSTKRKDDSCSQGGNFVKKANSLGSRAQLMRVPLSHRKVNVDLGLNNCYTQGVDDFLKTLHPSVASLLSGQSRLRQRRRNCTDY